MVTMVIEAGPLSHVLTNLTQGILAALYRRSIVRSHTACIVTVPSFVASLFPQTSSDVSLPSAFTIAQLTQQRRLVEFHE